ncbi:MAG: beta-galactosidase [Planctomycetia bacterium]|nr:beta-galactosidase [Planctomycetia bacterium]
MKKNVLLLLSIFAILPAAFCFGQVIDDSPTRVQTTLQPGMTEIGTLKPKNVRQIKTSQWTLGCETIDREYSDYNSFKEYLPALGISRIRLQAGWARCEKDPGLYDFGWLDNIINDAAERGISVWLETSYGNPGYPGGGGRTLAGGMPTSKEGLEAWDRWVTVIAQRYKGKVHDWCVWNEPEIRGANANEQICDFNIRTARIIRKEIPDARIAALAVSWPRKEIIETLLKKLQATGESDLFQWIVYHHYTKNPDTPYPQVLEVRELAKKYNPKIRLWQGESGVESEWCISGALSRYNWTELTQAKWDARRMLGDIGHGSDSLIFTAADLDYRTTSFHNGLVRYGLIKTAGADRAHRVLKVKMAYYTVQNIVSVFNDSVEWISDFSCESKCAKDLAIFGYRDKATQTPITVFWDKTDVPKDENTTLPARLKIEMKPLKEPVWVDTVSGRVYLIPKENVKVDGKFVIFDKIPAYDAPVFITDKSILDIEPSAAWLFSLETKEKRK